MMSRLKNGPGVAMLRTGPRPIGQEVHVSSHRSRRGALALALSMLVVACGSGRSGVVADYPAYATVPEMIDAADVILIGTVLSTRVEEVLADGGTGADPSLDPQAGLESTERANSVVVTVAVVEVTQVMKGDVENGQRIEVSQPGERNNVPAGTTLVEPGGMDYAFVLKLHEGAPYDLVNPQQGLYRVGADGRLTTVSEGNQLPVDRAADLEPGR